MSELSKNLRIKANVMMMGEKIAWGSDIELMMQAAESIDTLRAQLDVAVGALDELGDHALWGGDIEAYQRWVTKLAQQALATIKQLGDPK